MVSMKTIMKKKSTITPASFTALFRNQPVVPMMPYVNAPVAFPAASTAAPKPQPLLSTERPGPKRRVPARRHGTIPPVAPTNSEAIDPEGKTPKG